MDSWSLILRGFWDHVLSEKNGFGPFSNVSTIPGASQVVLEVKKKKKETRLAMQET